MTPSAPSEPPGEHVRVEAAPPGADDVAALLAQWQGAERGAARRRWLDANPDGRVLAWTARVNGVLAATTAVFPRRILVEGEVHLGSLGGDAYVPPAFRRRGLARRLHGAVRRGMVARGVGFMVGTPVPNNLAALVAEGARVVGRLAHYSLPLTGAVLAERVVPRGPAVLRRFAGLGGAVALGVSRRALALRGAAELRPVPEVGPAFDDLWARARRWHRVVAVRDAAFVRWRHADAPTPSVLHGLGRDGRLDGYVATVRVGDRLVLLDVLAATPADVAPLLGGVVRLALAGGCTSIGTRLNPATRYARELHRRGFLTGHDRPLYQVLADGVPGPLQDFARWHVTYGDEDMDEPAAFLAQAPPPTPKVPAARTRPKRVLYLVDTYINPNGGTEGQLKALVEHLPPRWRPELWIVQRSRWLEEHAFACPARHWSIRSLKDPHDLPKLLRLSRGLTARRFDLVQTFMGDAGTIGPLAARPSRTPVLVSRRDLGFWHTPLLAAAQRRAVRLAAGYVVNSEAVARHVVEAEHAPRGAIHVVHNGTPREAFDAPPDPGLRARLGLPPTAPLVGLLANFKPLKRQADLVEALARLRAAHPDLHVLFLGGGDDTDVRVRARALGVEDRIRVQHVATGVPSVLKQLTVGVLCSESEGLSNALLEYLGCALPVVATAVGGNPELVEDGMNGRLFAPGDVEALAAALHELLADPEKAAAMGRASRRRFDEGFGLPRMVDETVALYDRTVAGERARRSDLVVGVETSLDGLRALEAPWRALLGPLGFFQGPEWVLTWFAWSRARPYVLTVRDAGGRLVGLLPLARASGRRLELPGARHGADHLDVVAAPGCAADVADAVLDHFVAARVRELDLRHLSEEGALRLALRRRRFALPYTEVLSTTCPYVVAGPSGFDGLLAGFTSKHRGNLRRQVRAFRATEGAEVVRVTDAAACDAAIASLFRLHAARFQGRGMASSFSGPELERFHLALAKALAARGELALTFLRVKGRDIAVHYGFRQGGRMWHFQGGFDASSEVTSPGMTLLLLVLEEDVFGGGLAEYDFLDGAEAYKRHFASGERRLFDVRVFRPTALGRVRAIGAGAYGVGKAGVRARLRHAGHAIAAALGVRGLDAIEGLSGVDSAATGL